MRFFEFNPTNDAGIDKFVMILRNYIGRAASKKAPVKLNWAGLGQIAKSSDFEFAADYETFKSMYDSTPALQAMVNNFDSKGIELKVPGVSDSEPPQDGESSEEKVAKMAASAASQQLDQYSKGPHL